MGNTSDDKGISRRRFVTGGLVDGNKPEMVKMLTADGKLVEIPKAVLDACTSKKPSSNKEIYDWMDNPSKKDDGQL